MDAASAGGSRKPAAVSAIGVVVTSSAIASTFDVAKLAPLPTAAVLTVVPPTPTSVVERYVFASDEAIANAASGTASTHRMKTTFQRHSARRYPARSFWPVKAGNTPPSCSCRRR